MSNKRNHRAGRTAPTAPEGFLPILLAALRGTGIACVGGLLLLLGGAALASAQADPNQWIGGIGLAVTAMTALLAGCLTSRMARRAVLLCGLLSAALLLFGMTALSLIPLDDPTPLSPAVSLGLHAALLLLCIGGAYLGRRRQHR